MGVSSRSSLEQNDVYGKMWQYLAGRVQFVSDFNIELGLIREKKENRYICMCMRVGMCVCVCVIERERNRTCIRACSCLTLCNPMDCSLPGSSVHGIFQVKNAGAGCHFLLQGIFLTQGSNHISCVSCMGRWILYHWAIWEAWEIQRQWKGAMSECMSVPRVNVLNKWILRGDQRACVASPGPVVVRRLEKRGRFYSAGIEGGALAPRAVQRPGDSISSALSHPCAKQLFA